MQLQSYKLYNIYPTHFIKLHNKHLSTQKYWYSHYYTTYPGLIESNSSINIFKLEILQTILLQISLIYQLHLFQILSWRPKTIAILLSIHFKDMLMTILRTNPFVNPSKWTSKLGLKNTEMQSMTKSEAQ